jgi:four helix bundle protein
VGNFTQLSVYAEAVSLADEVRDAVIVWQSFDRWTVGVQLVRAADSVGANIAEGYGRHHPRDQKRFLFIARGSTHEAEHWIRRAVARGLLDDPGLLTRTLKVGRMLNGLIRSHPTT